MSTAPAVSLKPGHVWIPPLNQNIAWKKVFRNSILLMAVCFVSIHGMLEGQWTAPRTQSSMDCTSQSQHLPVSRLVRYMYTHPLIHSVHGEKCYSTNLPKHERWLSLEFRSKQRQVYSTNWQRYDETDRCKRVQESCKVSSPFLLPYDPNFIPEYLAPN
jgi:hypothetical protein